MLTSIQILKLLWKVKWFGGVFPIDRLPIHVGTPRSYIINLDESDNESSHWVAVNFYRTGRAFYFDPFGRPPEGHILTFIEKNSRNGFDYSRAKYHGDFSVSCGYFCILFVFLARNLKKFFRQFNECKFERNEKYLYRMMKRFID